MRWQQTWLAIYLTSSLFFFSLLAEHWFYLGICFPLQVSEKDISMSSSRVNHNWSNPIMAILICLLMIELDPVANKTWAEVCQKVSLLLGRYPEDKLPLSFLYIFSYLDIIHEINIIKYIYIWRKNEPVLEWIWFRSWQNRVAEALQFCVNASKTLILLSLELPRL